MLEIKESLVERILKEKSGRGLFSKMHDKEWYVAEKKKLMNLDYNELIEIYKRYPEYNKKI